MSSISTMPDLEVKAIAKLRVSIASKDKKNESRIAGFIMRADRCVPGTTQTFKFVVKEKTTKKLQVIHDDLSLLLQENAKLVFTVLSTKKPIEFVVWKGQELEQNELLTVDLTVQKSDSNDPSPSLAATDATEASPSPRLSDLKLGHAEVVAMSTTALSPKPARVQSAAAEVTTAASSTTSRQITTPSKRVKYRVERTGSDEDDAVTDDERASVRSLSRARPASTSNGKNNKQTTSNGKNNKQTTSNGKNDQQTTSNGKNDKQTTSNEKKDKQTVLAEEGQAPRVTRFVTSNPLAEVFNAHDGSLKYFCDFEAEIVEQIFEFMKAYQAGKEPKKVVGDFVAFLDSRLSRAKLREWMVFYILRELNDVAGQQLKTTVIRVCISRIIQLTPPKYCDTIEQLLSDPLRRALEERRNHEFFPCFTIDDALLVGPELFTSTPDLPLLTRKGEDDTSFQNFLEDQTIPLSWLGEAPVFWAIGVNASNFRDHPILKFNHVTRRVDNKKSAFDGMREPVSFNEWVSLYYYVVLEHCAKLSSTSMPRTASTSLASTADSLCEILRRRTQVLARVLKVVFRLSSGIEAIFWGDLLWRAFNQPKGNSPSTSFTRFNSLMLRRCNAHMVHICNNTSLGAMKLSVASLMPTESSRSNVASCVSQVSGAIMEEPVVNESWLREVEREIEE